jgi:hypothetical protein
MFDVGFYRNFEDLAVDAGLAMGATLRHVKIMAKGE